MAYNYDIDIKYVRNVIVDFFDLLLERYLEDFPVADSAKNAVLVALSGSLQIEQDEYLKQAFDTMLAELNSLEDSIFYNVMNGICENDFERFLVLASVAPEIDAKYAQVFSYIRGNNNKERLALNHVFDLYQYIGDMEQSWRNKLYNSNYKLNKYLLDLGKNVSIYSDVYLKKSVFSTILGEELSYPLVEFVEIASPKETSLHFNKELTKKIVSFISLLEDDKNNGLIEVICEQGLVRQEIAQQLAFQLQEQIVYADFRKLSKIADEERIDAIEKLATFCYLTKSKLLIDGLDEVIILEQEKSLLKKILDILKNSTSVIMLYFKQPLKNVSYEGFTNLQLVQPKLTMTEQRDIWKHYLEKAGFILDKDITFEGLASSYELSQGKIADVISIATTEALVNKRTIVKLEDIVIGVRKVCGGNITKLAQPLPRIFTWDDLVLEDNQIETLKNVCNRIKYRMHINEEWGFDRKLPYGRGVSLLIYGPPGTGKTMTAQVLSRELGFDAYRVDMSQIMDKYIGETEKKLTELFDAAKDSNAILFFDEADALFSKRTDVSDSHDKYANAETAHLLQKMEEYRGISIMATNALYNFDVAFKRRITYIMSLPMPSEEMRKVLWERAFPKEAPIGNLNFESLSKNFEFSGSNIKNCAVAAAFYAAAEGEKISRKHLAKAIREECIKTGKLFAEEYLL